MTQAADMIDAGLEVLHAHAAETVTYTEAGVAGQAVLALELKAGATRSDLQRESVFRRTDLTIVAEAWRGAQITASDAKVFTVVDRSETPGSVTFKATRALVRS